MKETDQSLFDEVNQISSKDDLIRFLFKRTKLLENIIFSLNDLDGLITKYPDFDWEFRLRSVVSSFKLHDKDLINKFIKIIEEKYKEFTSELSDTIP